MATLCYNIGDTGPAGGIIFALPFTGINQTKFYYEISLDDIEVPLTATLDNGDGVIPPVSVPALTTVGTEFGAYKQNVITSPAFGDGKKNTDILDALGIIPNSNPTIPARDLAATQCKQHGVTGPDGKDYADWFLPSKEEIEEAYIAVGAANLNLGGATVKPRWTSTGSLSSPFSATIAILVDQATPVVAPTFNPQADRSLPYGVRPIRRFVCKDKGLTYDYRLSGWSGGNTPGTMMPPSQFVNPDPITYTISIDNLYIYQHNNMIMPSGTSPAQTNAVILAFDSNNMTGDITNSGALNPFANNLPFSLSGFPTFLPYNGFQGNHPSPVISHSNLYTIPALPSFGFVWCPRLIVDQQNAGFQPNDLPFSKLWVESFPGSSTGQIIQNADFAKLSQLIGSNVDALLVFYNFTYPGGGFIGTQFSLAPPPLPGTSIDCNHNWDITISNPAWSTQLGSLGSHQGYQIGHDFIFFTINRYDVRGNNIRSIYESNFQNIKYKDFNIKIYDNFERLLGSYTYKLINDDPPSGCGATQCRFYMAMKLVQVHFVSDPDPVNPNVVMLREHTGMQSYSLGHGYVSIEMQDSAENNNFWNGTLTHGNTLNLVDWLGTGINQRVTDPNNLPSHWLTNTVNGNRFPWGVVCSPCGNYFQGAPCINVRLNEYLAEVEYDTTLDFCTQFNGPYNVYYPFNGITGNASTVGQGYLDALAAGCGGKNSSRITSPSTTNPESINECFENTVEDFISNEIGTDGIDVHIGFEQHEQTARQKFANKTDIETGPFGVGGYYPLYDTIEAARLNSPTFYASRDGEETYGYHIHKFGKTEYYMPNGLEMGVTQFHGDWDGTEIAEYSTTVQPLQTEILPIEATTIEEEQEEAPQEQPSTVIITPQQTPAPAPQQTPPPTYIPPSSVGGGSSGGGGGGY